jgi:PBSX family phage terminase large subunit
MQYPQKIDYFLKYPKTHNIFEGGRGGGKTRTISDFLISVMVECPVKIICAREVQKSLKESSFLVMKESIYRLGYGAKFKINESAGTIESASGGRAVFIGLLQHTVDSIKSYEGFHWVWIEEAQSVSKRSLETLIPTLRTDGWFYVGKLPFPLRMFIYTMNPYTWEDPINLVLPETRDDVRRIKINYTDNPWFPHSLEEERIESKKTLNHDEYLRIWEGIPFDSAENAVMTRFQVSQAMERKVSLDGGIVVGADIARFGDDRTVFIKRQGMQVIDTKVLSKKDTQEVASQLADFAQGGKIVIDDTGVGGGVTDKLNALKCNVVPINFGGSPMNKLKYPDIISEMWFNLAGIIDQCGLPHDNDLLAELSGRHYKYTVDERRKVESKDEYKKRTGRRSPDFADAMILCFYNRSIPKARMREGIPGL